jgi:hypothetical protein
MITIHNYFDKVSNIQFNTLPAALQKGNEFVTKATSNGTNWNSYQNSEAIKKTIDLYLERLNEHLNTKPSHKTNSPKQQHKVLKPVKEKKAKHPPQTDETIMVERIPEEIRFIKRFVNLNGKIKLKEDILRFVNSLQKAIVEKKIRKASPYAEQIKFIQSRLIDTYNTMKGKIKIELKQETYDALKKITGEEKVLPSINFIKRYIGMNGKSAMKEKAKQLLNQINKAYTKGKITDSDPYIIEIHELKKNLKTFITTASQKTLEIEQATLNGLEGVLGCACNQLNGLQEKPAIMNSMDFANMEFDTIGLQGKWLNLIGDPSSNFTAMVFGKPKMGKSYLCIDFAGYLARNHGKVLYVAREEGLDYTLQMKLNDKNVKHPNLFVASVLPENLSAYDFIFLDSVNKLGLSPEDLNQLKSFNPTKSFIFIFQSTKAGAFRGANTFQHDVDVVIEVPEKGKAVQMGRFNQGGEMEIF